jgi:type II secretory pathway pseudopilin PulG
VVERPHSFRTESGFTLVETLVAAFVLLIGVMAALSLLNVANRATATTRTRDNATNLARELIEGARNVPYEKVNGPGLVAELQKLPGLADAPAGGSYTIPRGPIVYTVAVDSCIVDDAKDGGGSRAGTQTFCANSTAPGTADKNPEDYKRVTVTVRWTLDGTARSVTQTGIINNPGSASGPAVRTLTPRGYAAPYTVTTDVNAITVDLTTSSRPATLHWLRDGTVQPTTPTANGSTGLAWQFDWPIAGLDDGAYIIGAEAFDQYGVSGPHREETVVLNRFKPQQPQRIAGGRNQFGAIEIEWAANTERDIVGYQVFRSGASSPVCPIASLKLNTSCVDSSAPSGGSLEYWVVAYDTNPSDGSLRAGDESTHLTVTSGDNAPPFAPTGLSAVRDAAGNVTLTWNRPSPDDPDAGDRIDFYRVYRDGVDYTNRFARWYDDGATVTWTDTATAGATHTYRVTSVDTHYMESALGAPVVQ